MNKITSKRIKAAPRNGIEDEPRPLICRQISPSPFLRHSVVSAMLTLCHLHAPTSIFNTLSKTLNLIFTIPSTRPLSPPILPAPSRSNLPLSHHNSFLISRQIFSRSTPRFCASEFSGSANSEEEEGLEEFEDKDDIDYSDSDNYDVDVTALEEEAKDAVREYSSSLSRILRIGEYSDPSRWIVAFICNFPRSLVIWY